MSPREREAYQLYVLAEADADRVRLRASRAPGTPAVCVQADGTELSVDEAMRNAPIPHTVAPGMACRCTYRPVSFAPLRKRQPNR